MNRNLLTQIKNEWRDNLWLCIELLIVSIAVWMLCLILYSTLRPTFEKKGYDITDVYRCNINSLDPASPEFIIYENEEEDKANDILALLTTIRRSSYVEVAALSQNALPYQFNYLGNNLMFKNLPDSVRYYANLRMATPEIARVLRLKDVNGSTPEQLEEILRRDEFLISDAPPGYIGGDKATREKGAKAFLGRQGFMVDSTVTNRVGAVIVPLKRNDYEQRRGDIIAPRLESNSRGISSCTEIAIRVKPGMGKKFEDEFYSNSDMRRLRNVYLTNLSDMQNVRKANQRKSDTEVRLWLSGIVFLFIIILLGLLGTFWFRIRQRTGEIALRKTCGATSGDIFRRILGEGMILLLIVTLPALVADGFLTHYLLRGFSYSMKDYSFSWIPSIIAFLISIALMAIMIVIGIYFPARKAMEIEPALALKDE